MDLVKRKCVPCEGGVPRLTAEEIENYQAQMEEPWEVPDNMKILKDYHFPDYSATIDFANKVAKLAEEERQRSMRLVEKAIHLLRNILVIVLLAGHHVPVRSELAAPVQAELADSVIAIEGVEIITDRLGQREARTGRHVTVIRGEDIGGLPVHSLDELLSTLPFIETMSRGGFGVQSDIIMRGGTFNQVLVLLDGMRINDPLTGHFNSYIPVPVTEILRIEVYRGPGSSIYGPDAVGGIIHIITGNFLPGDGADHVEGQLEVWSGQYALKRTNSGLQVRKGRLMAGAGVSYSSSAGHPLTSDTLRGDFNILTGSLSASYKISGRITAGMRTSYDRRLFNAMHFYTVSPLDLSREQVEKWWNQSFIRIGLSPSGSLTLQAAIQSTADSFLFNPVFPANIHRTQYQNYQAGYQHTFAAGHRISAGIQADRKRIESSDRGDHIQWHTGTYLIFSGRFNREFDLSGGLRMDFNPVFGMEVLPQLNAAWKRERWTIRGAAGRSIRSPDFTERYISTGLPGPLSPGRNLGNPGLVAERSWSLEAGIDHRLARSIQVKATGFYRFSRSLIDYVYTPSGIIANNRNLEEGESYFWARNIGLLNTAGIEAEMEGEHQLSGDLVFRWGGAWQLLESRGETGVVSKYLSAHARQLLNTRLGLSGDHANLQIFSLYKLRDAAMAELIDETLTERYILFNLRSDILFYNKRFIISLQVNNLLNRSYADILGANMPGRWISGGLTWRFTDK